MTDLHDKEKGKNRPHNRIGCRCPIGSPKRFCLGNPPTEEKTMDIKNKITAVMVDTHRSIIGEDGLTVWDFAELRDSLTRLFTFQEDSFRRKVEWLIGEDEETQHGPQRWVDAKAAIRNKFRAELRAKLKELK